MDGASHDTYALGKLEFVSDAGKRLCFLERDILTGFRLIAN